MSDTTARLLLLDGHSLAYRAFFALPVENFSTTTGQPTNAVYGFTSMLINLLRDENPTHLAVAFDLARASFRTQAYADYKAGRSETKAEFKGQVSLIQEVLNALRIPFLTKENYEADDILATLATRAVAAGAEVLICTGDRDAYQLVGPHCTVLYPRIGVSSLDRKDPPAIQAQYGIGPEHYRELAALVGDDSDNLSGVPGVGPKTAAKWINQYGSLDELVAQVDAVKGKAGDSLRAHLADVLRNYQLNALVTDLDLELGLDELHRRSWDREEVHQVFDTLQFRVLRDRLYATLEAAEPEADAEIEVAGEVLAPGAVAPWLAAHLPAGVRAGLAVEGRWGRGQGELTALAIAAPDGAAGWLDPAALTPEGDAAVAGWLADPLRPKAVHDMKGPSLALHDRGWAPAGVTSDTALAAYLVRPDNRTYDLADLLLRYLRRELPTEVSEGGQLSLDGLDETAATQHLMAKAEATRELAEVIGAELETRRGTALMTDVELPLVGVLADMERVGIAADTDHLADLESHFAAEVKASAQAAYDVVGREFNLGSPKQLQAILFEELKLPTTKRIKTGWTTDAEALQSLFGQTGHPLLEHLLRHRDVAKLKTTVDGLLKTVADDGRIHTTYNQMIAATGRLSSTDPNLQNIPVRTAEGRRIRKAFVVGAGYETLLTADYSQIEMRIMAHLSADRSLIDAFTSGADFHAATAASVFGAAPGEITGEQRSKIKAMNYGLAYGLSAFGLAQQLRISRDEATALMSEYFDRFGGVRDYLESIVAAARAEGWTETLMGRRRYLPDLTSDNRQRREMAERMAKNAPIQGSAADIIKVAMLRVDRRLRAEGLRSRLLLQVHDELVLETAPGERSVLEVLVREEMGAAFDLDVPLEVSVGSGRTWDDAAH